jgi:3-oxoacyl-[acyl-carrier-protein] synthase II
MKCKVVITAMGTVTPFGRGSKILWDNVVDGKSSIKSWNDLTEEGFRCSYACRVEDENQLSVNRGQLFTLETTSQILRCVSLEQSSTCGIFIGSTMGDSKAFEMAAQNAEVNILNYTAYSFAKSIQEQYGIKGPIRIYGTACAAGNYAVGCATKAIQTGKISAAIAGGVEPFSKIAMVGFSRSRAMIQNGICQPFDKDRTGMCLGEGAALFFLESEESALKNGRMPLAEIKSLGLSCDAFHITRPDPTGQGIIKAMNECINNAGIHHDEVDWICAHGTGTVFSDDAEAKAIEAVFGQKTYVSAIKGAVGHSLGAATAISLAVCIESIINEKIPPITNLKTIDPKVSINCLKNGIDHKSKYILNCGYAFGGINSVLMVAAWK